MVWHVFWLGTARFPGLGHARCGTAVPTSQASAPRDLKPKRNVKTRRLCTFQKAKQKERRGAKMDSAMSESWAFSIAHIHSNMLTPGDSLTRAHRFKIVQNLTCIAKRFLTLQLPNWHEGPCKQGKFEKKNEIRESCSIEKKEKNEKESNSSTVHSVDTVMPAACEFSFEDFDGLFQPGLGQARTRKDYNDVFPIVRIPRKTSTPKWPKAKLIWRFRIQQSILYHSFGWFAWTLKMQVFTCSM